VLVLLAVIAHSDVYELWCCGVGLLWWCGDRLVFLTVNLGRPNPSTVIYIYFPIFSGVLTPRACIW
jgi:hypothetical protein